MSKPNEYARACLDRLVPELVGLTVMGGLVDDSGENWGFTAAGRKGGKLVRKDVWVLCDPEGNGPGWLEILDDQEG